MRALYLLLTIGILAPVVGSTAFAYPNCSQVNAGWCYVWEPEGCTPFIVFRYYNEDMREWKCDYLEYGCDDSYWQLCWIDDQGGCDCLPEGSPITLADGTVVPIEELHEGDYVLAYNVEASAGEASPVISLHAPYVVDHYLVINHRIRVTETHPFLSAGKWISANRLGLGSLLTAPDGSTIVVTSIDRIQESTTVYNVRVSGGTYVAYGVVVHNKEDCWDYYPKQP